MEGQNILRTTDRRTNKALCVILNANQLYNRRSKPGDPAPFNPLVISVIGRSAGGHSTYTVVRVPPSKRLPVAHVRR